MFVRNGEVLSIHSSTVESQKDPYDSLTKSQTRELKKIYVDGINSVYEVDEKCSASDKC